jgi:hypothetical protein
VVDNPPHANLQQPSDAGRQITRVRFDKIRKTSASREDVRVSGPTDNVRSAAPSMSLLPPFRP